VPSATKAHVEAEFADIVKLEKALEKEGFTGLEMGTSSSNRSGRRWRSCEREVLS